MVLVKFEVKLCNSNKSVIWRYFRISIFAAKFSIVKMFMPVSKRCLLIALYLLFTPVRDM